jgi:hypothetical protein
MENFTVMQRKITRYLTSRLRVKTRIYVNFMSLAKEPS